MDVAYANITFIETQFRATGRGPYTATPPFVPGNGVGGVVAAVGEDVDPALVGTRVVAGTGGSGGYASRAVVAAADAFAVPDGVELDVATALLADGRTATLLVRTAEPKPGERVLVEAAAGGVGTLLVQLREAAGAHVVAAAGGTRKLDVARDLGADEVVDYREPGWAAHVARSTSCSTGSAGTSPGPRSGCSPAAGGCSATAWRAAPGAPSRPTRRRRGASRCCATPRRPTQLRAATRSALAEAAAGRLRPLIGQRYPLDRAADAHAAIESRATVGKTLLTPR